MPRSNVQILPVRCLLALALLALGTSPGFAAGRSGPFAFESLLRPATALQTALGGLHACGDAGPEALRANPAGLARASGLIASASHQAWQARLSEDWVGGVVPVASGFLGVEVSALHAGSLPAFDEDGTPLGSFFPVEMAAGIGYARSFASGVRSGMAVHALYLSGGGEALKGFSLDLGVEFTGATTRLGLAVRNLGPDPAGDLGTYHLPTQAVAGLEQDVGFRTCADLTAALDRDGGWLASSGARISGPGGMSILCGVAYSPAAAQSRLSPRAGLAVTLRTVLFAYSYALAGDAAATHHLSLQFSPRKG